MKILMPYARELNQATRFFYAILFPGGEYRQGFNTRSVQSLPFSGTIRNPDLETADEKSNHNTLKIERRI